MRAAPDVHVDEATLVRLLDDELSDERREQVEGHLSDCRACRVSRERLADLTRAFSGWAELAEPAERGSIGGVDAVLAAVDRHRSRSGPRGVVATIARAPAFRAAAVLVLLAGVALALPPLARWVEEGGEETEVESEATSAPGESPPGSVSVSFRPAGDRLVIRVERRQRAGALRVERASGAEVEARVTGGEGGEELTVLPDGLAVRNPGDSSANYTVAVPAAVREIDLFVAGRPTWSGSPNALPVEWTLETGPPAAGEEGER